MRQTFPCKEPQCPEHVSYEPQKVLGNFMERNLRDETGTEIVYLQCKRGHEYPYEVGAEE